MLDPYTKIGGEVFIRKGDQILLGRRKGIYGDGTWALPGGHVKYGERVIDAVCRELKEEIDATVTPADLELVSVVDSTDHSLGSHYLHITFELKDPDFEPRLMEPDECAEWRYFHLQALPEEIFPPHKDIIANYLKRIIYAK